MVIQCTSCQTKYRLNLERIPNRKTFVKCRNCGTPIYIDPPAEAAAAEPAVSRSPAPPAPSVEEPPRPAASAAAAAGTPVVACPNCATRYRVPGEALARPRVRLKCTQCGHVFTPGEAASPKTGMAAASAGAAPPGPHEPAGREFVPEAGGEPEGRAPERERAMPIPDETALEGMFDDLRDRASPFTARHAPPQPPPQTGAPKSAGPQPPGGWGAETRAPARPLPATGEPEKTEEPEAPAPDWEAAMGALEAAPELDVAEPASIPGPEPEPEPGPGPEPEPIRGEEPESLFSTDLERLGEQAAQAAAESRRAAPEFDADRAYREAVSLDDEDLPGRSKARGTIPDEHKYRFFLKPGGGPGAREEELFPPPTRAAPEPGAEPVDLEALAGSLESEAAAEPLADDVDALLKEHGLGEEPLLPDMPASPAEPPRSARISPSLTMPGAGSPRRERLLLAATLGLAAGVLVLLFFLGYALG